MVAALRVSMWLLVREEGLRGASEEKTDGPFSLKQASFTWGTCLMPEADSGLAWQIWKAVFTQGRM